MKAKVQTRAKAAHDTAELSTRRAPTRRVPWPRDVAVGIIVGVLAAGMLWVAIAVVLGLLAR